MTLLAKHTAHAEAGGVAEKEREIDAGNKKSEIRMRIKNRAIA